MTTDINGLFNRYRPSAEYDIVILLFRRLLRLLLLLVLNLNFFFFFFFWCQFHGGADRIN